MIILPANTLSTGGYEVANSCMFNSADSPKMVKTLGTPTSTKIGTISCWIKRCSIGVEQHFLGTAQDGNDRCSIGFDDSAEGELHIVQEDSGSYSYRFKTTARYRDPSAWMHLCLAIDTTQASASNRVKIYINGTQVTDFATETQPSQDTVIRYGISGEEFVVGAKLGGGGSYGNFANLYLAEVVFIDGQQLTPTSFGEFDEDSPTIWKPKDVSGLTFGTNGFYLDFEDSSNLGNDANGGTDLTEVNLAATDQATDTPTNNFATLNPLFNAGGTVTYSQGNNNFAEASNTWNMTISTFGSSSAKWYAEFKCNGDWMIVGVADLNTTNYGVDDRNFASSTDITSYGYGYYNSNGELYTAGSGSSYGNTYASGDIIGVALDCDNNKLYFSKNGTWQNSGDPTSGSTGTGAQSLNTDAGRVWGFALGVQQDNIDSNFGGCPSFSISSGNADGNGYGNFEYAPPSGYLSLCTKNLGSDGG